MSEEGHIIAVVGGKGGVGKSVFAANLTIAFAQNLKLRPMVIDLDLESLGDQNVILGLNGPKNIVDVSRMPPGPLTVKTLGPFMSSHQAGFNYIAAPREEIMAKDINIDGLGAFLKSVSKIFKITVIDCGNLSTPASLKALEYATSIMVVTTGEIMAINQTKRLLTKIQGFLFPKEMVQIILNKYSRSNVVSPELVQRNINRQIFAAIPDDPEAAGGALARSTPVLLSAKNSSMSRAFGDVVRKIAQTRMLEKLSKLKKPKGIASKEIEAMKSQTVTISSLDDSGPQYSDNMRLDPWTAMRLRIHKALVEKMDLKKTDANAKSIKEIQVLREKTRKSVLEILQSEDTESLLDSRELKTRMIKEVLDEALGLGPLEDLLADDAVTEIMVNARDQIYIEKSGKPTMAKTTFSSEQQMMNVIERIVTPLGRRIDEKMPYVDARLNDGSRVHVIIPPLALRGPTITIRKFPKKRFGDKDLIGFGTITQEISDFLRLCVEAKLNVVVSGGTGSGKTSLLNVLSNFIPASDRIITIEDSAELQLGQEHVVRLEARPANIEGSGEVSIRDLVKCSLRMRPDRIVVGECRSGEALDMLQAMNTGHDGSLTTLHANNPRESMSRLETLVMMAGLGLPSGAIKETIASAVDVIIQISRLSDGSRKVTHITEVTGMQGDVISLQDVFIFKQEGLDKKRKVLGRFVPTGFIPKFVEDMEQRGLKISRGLFAAK